MFIEYVTFPQIADNTQYDVLLAVRMLAHTRSSKVRFSNTFKEETSVLCIKYLHRYDAICYRLVEIRWYSTLFGVGHVIQCGCAYALAARSMRLVRCSTRFVYLLTSAWNFWALSRKSYFPVVFTRSSFQLSISRSRIALRRSAYKAIKRIKCLKTFIPIDSWIESKVKK